MLANLPSRDELRRLCEDAAREIMAVRREARLDVRLKADRSAVTRADLAAHRILVDGLEALTPDIPLLSEENSDVPWEERRRWSRYWLIDPLDGTREFIGGHDDFTVNVALIEDHRPVFGVVCAPATLRTWCGGAAWGAWRHAGSDWQPIRVDPRWPPRVLTSRSHMDDATRQWVERIPGAQCVAAGSSLKFCRIAEGEGDLYPRFGPTSEWDTAAAQAVLEGAGGAVVEAPGDTPLRYNRKASYLNPSFIACAALDAPWRQDAPHTIGPHG